MTTCPNCGSETNERQTFCGTSCRKTFNNMRMTRGAVLYDAFMAFRYDRGWAKAVGLWTLICRLVSVWRDEDAAAGRESFIRPEKWLEENRTWLRASYEGELLVGRQCKK